MYLCRFVMVKILGFTLSKRTFLAGQDLEPSILNLAMGEQCQDNKLMWAGTLAWVGTVGYLHDDLIGFAVSYSIWFDDGDGVVFIGWNYRKEKQLKWWSVMQMNDKQDHDNIINP